MATLKFTYFFKLKEEYFVKNNSETSFIGCVYLVLLLNYPIKKFPVTTNQTTVKIKSCSALLRMLLLYICSYLKSVLRYKFLILDTYHLDTIFV
jgi:hypothetical protein